MKRIQYRDPLTKLERLAWLIEAVGEAAVVCRGTAERDVVKAYLNARGLKGYETTDYRGKGEKPLLVFFGFPDCIEQYREVMNRSTYDKAIAFIWREI